MRGTNWDDLRFVLAAARAGSHAAAARRLGVNESTVARRVDQAGKRLGARLFERGPDGLAPTAAGTALIERAERIEREVQGAEAALTGADGRTEGAVRLTAVPVLANRLLAPALPRLAARHPRLTVEIVAEPRNLSLTRREADMALRLARPTAEQRAVARRVGALDWAVFTPARGGTRGWIAYDDAMEGLPQARWIAARIGDGDTAAPARAGDAETIMALVAAGAGRSLLPPALCRGMPGLRQEGPAVLSREVWLMTHPELQGLARIEAVGDWVAAALTAATGVPAGRKPPPLAKPLAP